VSGDIAGPVDKIGWNGSYILVEAGGQQPGWEIFSLDQQHKPVPSNRSEKDALLEQLRRSIVLKTPEDVWRNAP
jgi:hypothetical protein